MTWKMDCKFAPYKETAKHCKKANNTEKPKANKGYFGCAKHCRFYEPEKKAKQK
jgi:hypothetical protein